MKEKLPLTSYLQKRGFRVSMTLMYKNQVQFFNWTFVLKIPTFANMRNVCTKFVCEKVPMHL